MVKWWKSAGRLAQALIVLGLVALAACLPGTASSPGTSIDQPMRVLPALKSTGLSGSLYFVHYRQIGNQLMALDLASGQMRTIFSGADHSWLAAADVSPDGKQALLAYAPPPPAGQVQLANTDLMLMPLDGSSAPKALLTRTAPNESFLHPDWAPDGQSFYYTHNVPTKAERSGILSQIEHNQPGGQAQVLIQHALWPRVSPDGTKVAYLSEVQFTSDNELYLMNADGSNPHPATSAKIPVVDAHIFSPDGKTIYFSALSETYTPTPSPSSLREGLPAWVLDHKFGVQTAAAHNNPSDWFAVQIDSGQAVQLTHIQDVNMVGTFSPDGRWLTFLSQKGLFVMQPDGSHLTQIASGLAMGSIHWNP